MPRFLDLIGSIDWRWWMEEVSVRLDWWPDADLYLYWFVPRLALILMGAIVVNSAAIFAAVAWQRLLGPFVLWDSGE